MALWQLRAVGDRVTLTYHWSLRPGSKPPEACGEIESSAEADLAAWVFDQAEPGDLVCLTSGITVVRLVSPVGGARA